MKKVPYTISFTNIDNETYKGIIFLRENLTKEQLEEVVKDKYYSKKAKKRGVNILAFTKIIIKERRTK